VRKLLLRILGRAIVGGPGVIYQPGTEVELEHGLATDLLHRGAAERVHPGPPRRRSRAAAGRDWIERSGRGGLDDLG
jgi:hypothetical protein